MADRGGGAWGGPTPAALAKRAWVLVGLGLVAAIAMLLVKPIPQPEAYHAFKDVRPLLGIPNFLNVVSNLPFLFVGLMGLRWLRTRPANLEAGMVAPFGVVFGGLALTALGSAYYHWAPDSNTLVWDRLPIAVSFTALYAAVIAERISLPVGRRLLLPFALFGAVSVAYWHWTDDLRPYALAQFFPVATIPLILGLFPARYTRGRDYLVGVGFYVAAKIFEDLDARIFHAGEILSGHTLKHLAAAGGAWWIYRMLVLRSRCPQPG